MHNTFSLPIIQLGANEDNQGSAHSSSVNQTREYDPDNSYPIAASTKALIRRSTRVHVEFTKDAWKQFAALKGNIFTALIQAITVKADMALYITAHEEKGIHLDNICQEVCYEQGVFFLMKNIRGTWYITEVIITDGDASYSPVFFWTRIKRGCDVIAAKVLLCWRRLTAKHVGVNTN